MLHSTRLYKGFDAANPPNMIPRGCIIVCGYVAGGNARRIWQPTEWLPFQHIHQAPITVPWFGADPATEAIAAVHAVRALGWSPGRAIIGDCETNTDRMYWRHFARTVEDNDYIPVAYGSVDYVTALHATLYWGALYDDMASMDNLPSLPAGEHWIGKQYQADVPYDGTQVDFNVFDEAFLDLCGVGARQQ